MKITDGQSVGEKYSVGNFVLLRSITVGINASVKAVLV